MRVNKWIRAAILGLAVLTFVGCAGPPKHIKENSYVRFEWSSEGIPTINIKGITGRWEDADQFFDWVEHKGFKHIIINIHSPGGGAPSIFGIVNRMDMLKRKGVIVETRSSGIALSGGFILFVNGTKGYRKAHRNALFLIHGPQGVYGPVDVSKEEHRVAYELMRRIIAEAMGLPEEEIDSMTGHGKDWYFTGEDMLVRQWADIELR
jgi:ATP-dependent protease ClpP protease subunit